MLQTIRKFILSPVSKDENSSHKTGFPNTISLAVLLIVILVSSVAPVVFKTPAYGLFASGLTALPVLGVLWLVNSGHAGRLSQLFVFGLWALDTILITYTGGLQSAITPGYVTVAILSGILLSRRSTITLYVLMTVSGLGMFYAENSGLLVDPLVPLNGFAKLLSIFTNTALAAFLVDVATTRTHKALTQAQDGEGALAEANETLKKEIAERIRTEDELRQLKEFNENIVQSVAETIIIEDENGIMMFANPRTERLLGYSPDELMGKHWSTIVQKEQIPKVHSETTKRPGGIESQYEITLLKKDGVEIPVITSARPMFKEGQFQGVISAFTDISERRYTEQALIDSERKYRSLVENLNVGVYRANGGKGNRNFIHANSAIVKMFGYENLDEFLEVPALNFFETPIDSKRLVDEVIELGSVKDRELCLIKKDGHPFWVSCTATAQFNEDGKLKWIDGVIEDITQRKQTQEQLLHDAFHDSLTQLPNRTLFFDRLQHAMARASRHRDYHYAVLFLDLDRFKLVNDSLGHKIGDLLLIMVANRLFSFLRSVDTIARLGGDEFVILLDEIEDIAAAASISTRIQQELKHAFQIEGHEVYTSASIGIVFHSDEYQSPEEILRDADTAMYRAKRLGKDRYELFDPQMRQDVIERMRIETELRRAYKRREFRVYYQPLNSIKTDRIIGFEALLRWQHPTRGLLLPADFLDVAEETGLIITMGEWVFQEACFEIQRLQNQFPQDPPLFVSINLSRRQFTSPALITDLQQVLSNTGLDPATLAVEITENVLMDNTEITNATIQKILDLGIKIQMDDFGTGYSSLATLHRFPIGALKIAREFILEIESNQDRSEVVRTIISLARVLDIHVIAEGVENSYQLDYLKKENCDMWQGFYCAKPMSPDYLYRFLTEKHSGVLSPPIKTIQDV